MSSLVSYEESRSRLQKRKRRGMLAGIALLVVAAIVAVFAVTKNSGADNDASDKPATVSVHDKQIGTDPTVTVSGVHVPRTMRADIAKNATAPSFRLTTALSPVLEIGPSGKLKAPATITITFSRKADPKATIVVATNPTHTANGWTLVAARNNSGTSATFTVDHLSWFRALLVDIKGAVSELKREVVDGITAGVFAQAEQPDCTGEDKAKTDDYSITSSAKDTLYWCFGYEDNHRIIKVVNRRNYPLELNTSNLTVVSSGHGSLDLAGLARLGHHTIVMPGEQAVLRVNSLKAGQQAIIDSKLTYLAMGLHTVDVIGTAIVSLTTHMDMSKFKDAHEFINDVLNLKNCVDVLGDMSVGRFLAGCFDGHTLAKFFNWRSAILAPVMMAFSAISLAEGLGSLTADSKNGRAAYNVTVSRQTNPFADFIGTWVTNPDYYSLVVDSLGHAVMGWQGFELCPGETDRDNAHCHKSYSAVFNLMPSGKDLIGTITSSTVTDKSSTNDAGWRPGVRLIFHRESGQLFGLDMGKTNVALDLFRR